MDLREVCRIPGFHTAVLATFNFDPLFFERVVLRDLLSAGCRQVVVLADGAQCLPAIEAVRGQVFELGRSYELFPVWRHGAFHPKLLLKFSDSGALVSCGSHNVSRAGWLGLRGATESAGNREVATAWRVDSGAGDPRDLVTVLEGLHDATDIPPARDLLERLLAASWIRSSPVTPTDRQIVMPGRLGTLADQLARRWANRRFERLRIATGSTDEDGAFIAWAARTFGVREAIVELDPSDACFLPERLRRLPVSTRFVLRPAPPRPHLKAVRFDGEGPSGLVAGSANCSAAAWLIPPDRGGNIEAVVAYDAADAAVSEELFASTDEAVDIAGVSFSRPTAAPPMPAPGPRLLYAGLDRGCGRLTATLSVALDEGSELELVLQDDYRAPALRLDERRWVAQCGPIERHVGTLFCRAVVVQTGAATNSCWIHDLHELRTRAGRHMDIQAMQSLGNPSALEDPAHVLRGMTELARFLLTQEKDDPPAVPLRSNSTEGNGHAAVSSLTLEHLIASLEATTREHPARAFAIGSSHQSLQGVLRAIFYNDNGDAGAAAQPDTIAEERRTGASAQQQQGEQADSQTRLDTRLPTEQERRRLTRQVSRFIDEIARETFADTATARQLQQAVAFPLGCGLLAQRGDWIGSAQDRSDWGRIVRRTCDTLLSPRKSRDARVTGPWTLIERTRGRYAEAGRAADFDAIMGDGSVWLTLVAAVTRTDLGCSVFERMLLLNQIARTEVLRCSMSSDQLSQLTHLLSVQQESGAWLEEMASAVRAMDRLQDRLRCGFEDLCKGTRRAPRVGDWLWRPQVGFARIDYVDDSARATLYSPSRSEPLKNVQLGFYVNLRTAGLLRDDGLPVERDSIDVRPC